MNSNLRWLCVIFAFAAANATSQDAPSLPEGLEPFEKPKVQTSEPELPTGLDLPNATPALPPGLDSVDDTVEESVENRKIESTLFPIKLHGFWETRGGVRITEDSVQPRDATLGETRLQLNTKQAWDTASVDFAGDLLLDGVMEEVDFDLRQLRFNASLTDSIDLSFGRQIHTWGTGDLLFINDLFPKDWQSFLIGRDVEYLKAPSDSLKLSFFGDSLNLDVVYTPRFDPDRFIIGERISFWSPNAGQRIGRDMAVNYDKPDNWFDDDEVAFRLHRTFGSLEAALYGYDGFWKSPAGFNPVTGAALFPRLAVYGASFRDTIGKGVVHAEIGYYDSKDDRNGNDPFVDNSESRYLIGYERELAKELTGTFQFYAVHLMDYDDYMASLPSAVNPRSKYRYVLTIRLTKLLMNQDLTLSNVLFYSPSDEDGYLRPQATFKVNDHWEVSGGANLFYGKDDHTFYAQFEDNSNVYLSARFSF